jgi:hypothetical protein
LCAVGGLFSGVSKSEASASPLIFVFIIPLMLIVVIGFQRINPFSAKVWYSNSMWLNPFNPAQPYQFFTLVGQMMLLLGLSNLVASAINPSKIGAVAEPLATGVGLLLGIKLCQLVFRGKNP